LLVENVMDYAIILLDPRGHVLIWNPAAARLKGYRAEDILGQHFSRFYLPAEVQHGKPERALQLAAAQGPVCRRGVALAPGWMVLDLPLPV
jgi:PAS domain S-box-containing protein